MTTPDPTPLALCIYCHYDLSAQAAQDSPEITCPECGRTMKPVDAINRANDRPAWSFEHSRRISPRRWLATSLRVFTPHRFWREIAGRPSTRPSRWLLFLATWLALLHLISASLLIAIRLIDDALWLRSRPTPSIVFNDDGLHHTLLKPYTCDLLVRVSDNSGRDIEFPSFFIFGAAFLIVPPVVLAAMRWMHAIPRHSPPVPLLRTVIPPIAIIIPWSLGVPALLAATVLIDRELKIHRTGALAPYTAIAWLLAGAGVLGAWWYANLRRSAPRWKALLAVFLTLVLTAAAFGSLMGLLYSLGFGR